MSIFDQIREHTYKVKKDRIYMDGEFTIQDLEKIVRMCKKIYYKEKLKKIFRWLNGC